MSISNYLELKLLTLVFKNTTFPPIATIYAQLHTGPPGEAGTSTPLASTPMSAITFNAASASGTSTVIRNAAAVTWTAGATGFITDISLWDTSATATANHLWYGALNTSKAVNAGDTVTLASAALTVTLD